MVAFATTTDTSNLATILILHYISSISSIFATHNFMILLRQINSYLEYHTTTTKSCGFECFFAIFVRCFAVAVLILMKIRQSFQSKGNFWFIFVENPIRKTSFFGRHISNDACAGQTLAKSIAPKTQFWEYETRIIAMATIQRNHADKGLRVSWIALLLMFVIGVAFAGKHLIGSIYQSGMD